MVTSYALVVPLAAGEEARRIVASLGIGRRDLKLGRREGRLLIPITNPIDPPLSQAVVEVAEFDPTKPPGSYKQFVRVPEALRASLPSSFDIVGDLVLIKIPQALASFSEEIGRAILEAHPNLRGVFLDEGVAGPFRVRRLRCVAGENRTRTLHAEYGARFQVDLASAYFSPRLANEHDRIARLVRPGEHLVDATAGVGPFSILAARRQPKARITAIDLNPDAFQLLGENLALNGVEGRVSAIMGDAETELPSLAPFGRAVVNLPHAGEGILRTAAKLIGRGGSLHYYVVWPEQAAATQAEALLDRLRQTTGRGDLTQRWHTVHPYSPKDRLVGVDIHVPV